MRGVQTVIFAFRQFCRVFSAITSIATGAVVIHHIVDVIKIDHPVVALSTIKTAGAFIVVNQQVMMISSRRTTPLATISACSLWVTGVIQSLMDNAILHRDKMAVVGIHILLRGPSELAVVNDIMRAVLCAESVLSDDISVHIISSDTKTDVTDDEVFRSATIDFVMGYDNSCPWSSLSGNRVVLTVYPKVFDETYLAGHGKTDRQGFIGILFHCPTQTSLCRTIRIVG